MNKDVSGKSRYAFAIPACIVLVCLSIATVFMLVGSNRKDDEPEGQEPPPVVRKQEGKKDDSDTRPTVTADQTHPAKRFYDRRKVLDPPESKSLRSLVNYLNLIAVAIQEGNRQEFRRFANVDDHVARMVKHHSGLKASSSELRRRLKENWEFSLPLVQVRPVHIEQVGRNVAQIYTWCADVEEVSWRVCWHFQRKSDLEWALVDWQILDWNHTESVTNAEYFFTGSGDGDRYQRWNAEIQAFQTSLQNPAAQAEDALQALHRASLIDVQSSVRGESQMRLGNCWMSLGFAGRGLEWYRRAAAPGGAKKVAAFMMTRRRFRSAIDAAEGYLEFLGSGPWVHLTLADANLAIGRFAEAHKHFGAALDCRPNDVSSLIGLARAQPVATNEAMAKANLAELMSRLKRTEDSLGAGLRLLQSVLDDGNLSLVARLTTELKKESRDLSESENASLLSVMALALEHQGQESAAGKLLFDAYQKEQDESYRDALLPLIHDYLRRHKGLVGMLQESPQPPVAIQRLVEVLEVRGGLSEPERTRLAKAVATYHGSRLRDPLPLYVEGMFLTPAGADQSQRRIEKLKRAVSLHTGGREDRVKSQIIRALATTLLEDGQAEAAYDTSKPRDSVELATLLAAPLRRKQWAIVNRLLAKFVAQYKKPDPVVELFRALVLQGQGQQAATLLKLSQIKPGTLPVSQRYRLWNALQETHIHFGTELELFKNSKDKLDTFERLSQALLDSGKRDAHQRLCAALEKSPTGTAKAHVLVARSESHWGAADLPQLAKVASRLQEVDLVGLSESESQYVANCLVRAHLRQGNGKMASAVAQRFRRGPGIVRPTVLTHLAQKDFKSAQAALDQCWYPRQTLSDLLYDPDVGTMVRAALPDTWTRSYPLTVRSSLSSLQWIQLYQGTAGLLGTKQVQQLFPANTQPRVTLVETNWTKKNQLRVFVIQAKGRLFTLTCSGRPLPVPGDGLDPEVKAQVEKHASWISLRLFNVTSIRNPDDATSLFSVARALPTAILVGFPDFATVDQDVIKQLQSGEPLAKLRGKLKPIDLPTPIEPLSKALPLRRQFEIVRQVRLGKPVKVVIPLRLEPLVLETRFKAEGFERTTDSMGEVLGVLDPTNRYPVDLKENRVYSLPVGQIVGQ